MCRVGQYELIMWNGKGFIDHKTPACMASFLCISLFDTVRRSSMVKQDVSTRFDNKFMQLITTVLSSCGTTNERSPKVVSRHVVRNPDRATRETYTFTFTFLRVEDRQLTRHEVRANWSIERYCEYHTSASWHSCHVLRMPDEKVESPTLADCW